VSVVRASSASCFAFSPLQEPKQPAGPVVDPAPKVDGHSFVVGWRQAALKYLHVSGAKNDEPS
jgi:hypothetical protein